MVMFGLVMFGYELGGGKDVCGFSGLQLCVRCSCMCVDQLCVGCKSLYKVKTIKFYIFIDILLH